jgi:hypothetical protein
LAYDIQAAALESAYWRAYRGRFDSLLKWADTDAFLAALPGLAGAWFLYDTEAPVPDHVTTRDEIAAALGDFAALLDEIRGRTACGAIYVDDRANPSFVKLFDPFAMGTSCGGPGHAPALPRWILSRMQPDPIPETATGARGPGLWERLTRKRG